MKGLSKQDKGTITWVGDRIFESAGNYNERNKGVKIRKKEIREGKNNTKSISKGGKYVNIISPNSYGT